MFLDLFDMDGFSFDDLDDVFLLGQIRQGETFYGEAAWMSEILSPFGYEICFLDSSVSEKEEGWIKEEAAQRGIHITKDPIEEAARCKVIAITGLFAESGLPMQDMKKILETGIANDAKICVDPGELNGINIEEARSILRDLAPNIHYFLPNEEEARILTGKDSLPEMSMALREMGIQNVFIKMGGNGCFVRGEGAPFAMGAIWGEKKDCIGSGANFMAGLIYGLFQDWQMKTICEFATGCAAASLRHDGPVEGARNRKDEVKKLLNNPYL